LSSAKSFTQEYRSEKRMATRMILASLLVINAAILLMTPSPTTDQLFSTHASPPLIHVNSKGQQD